MTTIKTVNEKGEHQYFAGHFQVELVISLNVSIGVNHFWMQRQSAL